MENVDIEKAAVRDVGKYIDGPLLRSFISENDRTPIWDGDIFIYHGSKKDNEHFYGRVPLQVKGTEVTEFSDKEISYSKLTRRDLENFIKDGGCIFFVAELMMNDETQETVSRVFYCELSVAVITNLLNKKKDVQHPTFHLSPVPKKSDFPKIVADFSDARYKNLVVRDIDEIEGLEKRIDELLNITNCINKDEYKSFFSTHIANLEAMKREKESIWSEIKENYANLNSKIPNVVDESIRAEINLHSNYLLSNLYNCLSKWLDKFLVWIPEIIEIASTSKKLGDGDLYHLIYNYAKYLLSHKKYHLIGNYFDRALKISKEASSSDSQWRVTETLYSMAELHRDLNLYTKAKDEYTEVLNVSLAGHESVEKLEVALNCIYNLTFLYDKLNCPKEAKALFNGLLNSLRLAANDDPSYFNWYLFNTFISLAFFYKGQFQYEEMNSAFEEAQIIYEKLPMNQIDLDSEFAADTHMNIGAFHSELNRYKEAESEYRIALKIYKNLAKSNRDAYINTEAKIHKNLAILLSENQPKKAEKECNKALKIFEELAEVNPSAYMGEVASLHKRLAILFKETKPEEVEKEYNDALRIYKELAVVDPDVYMGDVADILSNLGRLHINSNSFVNAEKELKQALDIHKVYVTVNPNKYNLRVANDLFLLSLLYKNDGCHIKEAKQACEESLGIIQSLAEDSPEIWMDLVLTTEQLLNTINEELRTV